MRDAEKRKNILLIVFCWLVYTVSYLGKYSYNANINQVMDYFKVNHAEAGLVSTCFFFAYGAGQILHGFLSKKYNCRYVITVVLIVSAAINLGVAFIENFAVVKYLWAVNGLCLAVLWPLIIKVISENLDPERFNAAVVVMGTTTAVGTVASYGLSALFIYLKNFKIIFYAAGIVLPLVAIGWFLFFPFMTKKAEAAAEAETENVDKAKVKEDNLLLYVIGLGVIIIVSNIIKDGLSVWLPSILIEHFGFNESISVILSLILPMFGILGCFFIVKLGKKIKNCLVLCSLLMFGILLAVAAGWLGVSADIYVVLIAGCGLASCVIYGLNNIITSKYPLQLKNKKNVGVIAGVLNGLSYVGSTISSYGLGGIADKSGWNGVFELFVILCACTAAVFGAIIAAIAIKKRRGEKK